MKYLVSRKLSRRPISIAAPSTVLVLSLCTTVALACDPNNVKHVPCPASPTHQALAYTAASKPAIGPVSPGPLHAASDTAPTGNPRSIIFVGGKPSNSKGALKPQPIPPGHSNPQPIPPGKVLPASPPKWDVSKNKSS